MNISTVSENKTRHGNPRIRVNNLQPRQGHLPRSFAEYLVLGGVTAPITDIGERGLDTTPPCSLSMYCTCMFMYRVLTDIDRINNLVSPLILRLLSHPTPYIIEATMSVVDQQNIHSFSSSSTTTKLDPSPTLLTLNFAPNPTLRQVTTLLRRVWLLDPPLSDQELADPTTVSQCLQSVTQLVGGEFSFSSPSSSISSKNHDSSSSSSSSNTKKERVMEEEEDDDEEWKTRTQFRILSHPVVLSAEKLESGLSQAQKDNDDAYLRSVVSPWREEIYDVYRHVFADLWRMVFSTLSSSSSSSSSLSPNNVDNNNSRQLSLGVFEPTRGNAVSVAALPSAAACSPQRGDNTMTTSFPTDTFLYPVWVSPRAKVTFSAQGEEGEKHSWLVGEAKTWTTGLWVKAGQGIVLRTERIDGEGKEEEEEEEETGLAAVFVTGHCDERKD